MSALIKESSMHRRNHACRMIPHHSLVLLIAVQIVVSLPFINQLTPWIITVTFGCAIWRWLMYRKQWRFPPLWVRAVLVCLIASAVVRFEGLQYGLETWASLLLMAFALKLIETKILRDAYTIVFLAYFLIATEFLFDHSLLNTAYQMFAFLLCTGAMVNLNQRAVSVRLMDSLKTAGKLILHAVPLMVVLFLIFPRISPFWSVPLQKTARTGLAEEMTPGDIARLTRSDAIVLRAVFDSKPPPLQQLYWRGLVYSMYDHGTWSQGPIPQEMRDKNRWIEWTNESLFTRPYSINLPENPDYSYRVLLEPTQQRWQFGLDLAIPRHGNNGLTWNFRLLSREPMDHLTYYEVDTYTHAILDPTLPNWLRQRELYLPKQENPRIRTYAQELIQHTQSPEALIAQVLRDIRRGAFRYTLRPPTLSRANSIDQFWFETQAGFCTHYAGALVFILRAAGIPARMVGGYQGGEFNPVSGHVVVRQYHAHAWVEAWLPGKGWQRIDPTAAVAPARVEQGLEEALPEEERTNLSAFTYVRLGNFPGLSHWMYWFESLEHRWNMMVINYDHEKQSEFLSRWLGEVTAARIGFVLMGAGGISLLLASISLVWQRVSSKPSDPLLKLLQSFCRRLERYGYRRRPEESYSAFLYRICDDKPECNQGRQAANAIEQLLYNPSEDINSSQLNRIKEELKMLFSILRIQRYYPER